MSILPFTLGAISPSTPRLVFVLSLIAVASSGCSKTEASKDQLLSRADNYFAAGQYDKAETEYRNVLKLTPTDPVAQRQLGIIYFDQGQVQAYPLLKKSAELEPDNVEVQSRLGSMLLLLGDAKEARAIAVRVLDQQPGHEQALRLFASAALTPSEIDEAQSLIARLREKDQDRPAYHVALGELALRQKDAVRAEKEFQAALSLDATSSAAHAALGSLYWARNDRQAAEQAFKTAADLAPLRSPIRLSYAEFKLRTGAVEEARTILEDVSSKLPDFLPPRIILMKIACANHHDDDCATRVQSILAQDSINYAALFQDGVINLAKGDATKAIREYEYLSNTYKRNTEVRYQLAQAYLLYAKSAGLANGLKAIEVAEKSLDEAIKLNPVFEPAVLLLAQLKINKKSPAAAVELLAPLIKDRPQTAQAHYLLASAYLAQQKKDEALAVYRHMTEIFPQDPRPAFLIGMMQEPGQRVAARQAFEKSAAISPNYLPALEALMNLDIADKKYADALERAQKQIDKDPKAALPLVLRSKVYLAQRDFAHAEPDLLKAIDLDPKLESAYLLLANLYVASNRQDEAIAKLTGLVEQNKSIPSLMQLAIIHERLKHFDAARDTYEKVLTVSPNFTPALNQLALLYSEHLGKLDTAHEFAKKAHDAAPSEPHMTDTLGWILFKKGEYDNALQLLQESASKLPNNPEIQFHLGMAHYMLGDDGTARSELKQAADATIDFVGKDEASKRLSILAIDPETLNAGERTELQNYLREWPNDPAALVRLARVQQRDGDVDQAIKTYERAITNNPSYAPAIRQLALLYGRQRSTDTSKAYELATKARFVYPDDPDIAKTLGILSYRRGLFPQSVELLKQAGTKRKNDPELFYYLGQAHRELKQWNECEAAMKLAKRVTVLTEAGQANADCSEIRLLDNPR